MIELKDVVRRIDQIPTLPVVATAIMSIVDSPDSSARDLQRLVIQDPPLATKILKTVNSAYFGMRRKISDLNQAIVLLGFNLVKSIAMGIAIFDMLEDQEGKSFYRREDFWTHSVSVATLCRLMARAGSGLNHETAFACGLLHDIGKLAMDRYLRAEFQAILLTAEASKIPFCEAETQILNTSHTELGAWLMQHWKMPGELSEAVRHHHTPEQAKDFPRFAAVCACGDYLINKQGIRVSGEVDPPSPAQQTWDLVGLPENRLQGMIGAVAAEAESLQDAFSD